MCLFQKEESLLHCFPVNVFFLTSNQYTVAHYKDSKKTCEANLYLLILVYKDKINLQFFSTGLAFEFKVKLHTTSSLICLWPTGLPKKHQCQEKTCSHMQLQLKCDQSNYSQQKEFSVSWERPKNNLTNIVSFSQSLRGQRRKNLSDKKHKRSPSFHLPLLPHTDHKH